VRQQSQSELIVVALLGSGSGRRLGAKGLGHTPAATRVACRPDAGRGQGVDTEKDHKSQARQKSRMI
jgi:hypothetical protein